MEDLENAGHGATGRGADPGRCGVCGARRPAGAAWCPLCHTPVPAQATPGTAGSGDPGHAAAEDSRVGSTPVRATPVGSTSVGSAPARATPVGGLPAHDTPESDPEVIARRLFTTGASGGAGDALAPGTGGLRGRRPAVLAAAGALAVTTGLLLLMAGIGHFL